MTDQLAKAIQCLTRELKEGREHRGHDTQIILKLLKTMNDSIKNYVAAQKVVNEKLAAASADLAGDVKALNDKIVLLNNTPDGWTPDDQAALDQLQTQGDELAAKLAALAALTPPVAPAAEPAEKSAGRHGR